MAIIINIVLMNVDNDGSQATHLWTLGSVVEDWGCCSSNWWERRGRCVSICPQSLPLADDLHTRVCYNNKIYYQILFVYICGYWPSVWIIVARSASHGSIWIVRSISTGMTVTTRNYWVGIGSMHRIASGIGLDLQKWASLECLAFVVVGLKTKWKSWESVKSWPWWFGYLRLNYPRNTLYGLCVDTCGTKKIHSHCGSWKIFSMAFCCWCLLSLWHSSKWSNLI